MSLALLCPGQGAQHPAMFDHSVGVPAAESVLAAAAQVLGADPRALAGDDARYDNAIAQPLVCAAVLANAAALLPQLSAPALLLGYSIGELAAHALAGGLEANACLALAVQRAQRMDAASRNGDGLIAVQGLLREQAEALCAQTGLHLAIVNGGDHLILGGHADALAHGEWQARAQRARVKRLPVSVAAHTPLLASAAQAFAADLRAAPLAAPRAAVLAGIDGHRIGDRDDAVGALSAQLATTLDWAGTLRQAAERGVRVFLELGPGGALARIAREVLPECQARSVEEFGSLAAAAAWVRQAEQRMQ
ncbi:[acyl-carrier-protein] S-malonyltransferase [Xanthomonas sacchari]|uniref:acyltransferase domain-containing protein n=1 Tax=unclassified Xanthomonas TaxID=2643310 RepID=UPI00136C482C|nr:MULTISPECIES: acyltransferase domain-containing protein [unclassified Xanthomonas]MBB6367300.1 [acyl-carrier-protein] S-malonyltransferase [Xanthomonas sp. F10]MXV31680.1 acyltransferase domain-containing protein [Xanthomonas sp. LMG 8989]